MSLIQSTDLDHSVRPGETDVEMVQLLTPDGRRIEHPDYPLTISDDEIGSLYRDLVLVRRIDTEAVALQRQGELGLWASMLGQEGIQIGAGRALAEQDMVFPSYREHAIAWCRGLDPIDLLGTWRGADFGWRDPLKHNFANYTIVIAAHTLHAAGYAMGVMRDGAVGTGDSSRDTAVLACFGDGATSQGDIHEALVWASTDHLPMVFLVQNNQYAISAPVSVQSRTPLYQRSLGYGVPGVRVDGNDVLAGLAVVRRALDDARNGQGPSWIEAYTYRMNPHTTNDDPRRYRESDEAEHWKKRDPILRVRTYLERDAAMPSSFFNGVEDDADALGRADSRRRARTRRPDTRVGVRQCLLRTHRGTPRPTRRVHNLCEVDLMTGVTLAKALNASLRKSLEDDAKVLIMGEDVGKLGGVFRVTDGLQKDFGDNRVFDTPLAESGIVGTAIGLAMRGYRPVCEIQFDGFVFPAFDQIVNQLAKLHNRSSGTVRLPITIRIPFGGGIGAVEHHSESPEAYFAHTPGLKVVACSGPSDGYWMLQQAIASDDPVIFFEPKRRYHSAKEEIAAARADGSAPHPFLHARVVRPGRDVTVLAYGAMVGLALDAATVAADEGRKLEVIDLCSMSPLDMPTVLESVRRTGHLIVVHEASGSFGVGAEVAARVQEQAFYSLEAPVLRVTGHDTPYPPSRIEIEWLPYVDRFLDAVDKSLGF